MTTSPQVRRTLPPELEGERLDRALAALFPAWSRSKFQGWIRAGRVRVAGEVERGPGHVLQSGVKLEVELPAPPQLPTEGEARERLVVLHEDEHLVAIDKPAGLLTHRGDSGREVSLADFAAALYGSLPSVQGADRPGIVHRLDRDTSGVIVLGRGEEALADLLRQFREREVQKSYLALVYGEPRFDTDWIEAPIGRAPRNPDRMAALPEGEGREASTYYEVRERFGDAALLECRPRTGRTHQIRVHLASIGFPLIGETLYRRRNIPRHPLPPEAPTVERQMLHASALELSHPATGEALRFNAPLPADIERLLDWFRSR